jgi:hypothetical protein
MEYVKDGYCGLYCGACPLMLATIAGTAESPCYGCKSELPAGHCATCAIKSCARERGYEFCYECAELDGCEKMHAFMVDPQWPYHQAVLTNFDFIEAEGQPAWLDAQDKRWRCAACGESHSWWDEACKNCGQPVASYKADL